MTSSVVELFLGVGHDVVQLLFFAVFGFLVLVNFPRILEVSVIG